MTTLPIHRADNPGRPIALLSGVNALLARIPEGLISVLARWSVAAVFWKSGQTKIEGLSIDLVEGRFSVGWPRLADGTVDLFRDEYRLPILPPEVSAVLAATAEHVFPVLLLLGLATRLSALALLAMTAVIQVFVYPGAYATHGVWAVALLFLMRAGAGPLSFDAWLSRHARASSAG